MRFILFAMIMCMGLGSAAAREIVNPDEQQMELIYRYLAGDPPDFSQIARESYEVRRASEFDRANVAARVEENLRNAYATMQEVESVRLRSTARFSEYDADAGAYYLSPFTPDSYFPFGNIRVTFDNADDFHTWAMPVAEARDILEKARNRQVILDLAFRPIAVDGSRGKRLRAQLTHVDIYAAQNGNLLSRLSIPEDEYRDPVIAGTAATPLDPERKNIQGLEPSMTANEVIDWAFEAGLELYVPDVDGQGFAADEKDALIERLRLHGYHRLFFASDARAFEQEASPYATGATDFPEGGRYSIFGAQLDCNAPGNLGVKCGYVRLEPVYDDDGNAVDGTFVYAAMLQSASGMTREQAIALLTDKYGQPGDNIRTSIFRQFHANLLVWGHNIQNAEKSFHYSPITWTQNWEVEAYITEPEPDRLVVVTLVHGFAVPEGTASSGGEIKF